MAVNWNSFLGSALSGLGGGMMQAGSPNGNFAQGFMGGSADFQQQLQQREAAKYRELQTQMLQQQMEQQRTANTDAAADKAKIQQLIAGGGMMDTSSHGNYGATTGGALQPSLFDPQTAQQLQGMPYDLQRSAVEAKVGEIFAKPKERKTTTIAGRLVDAETGEEIKDYSAQAATLAQASRPVTNVNNNLPGQESEYAKAFGKVEGESAAAITPAADKSRMAMDQLTALKKSVAEMTAAGSDPGRWAPMLNELSAYAQAAGFDPKSLNLPANAGPSEQASAILNKLALANIGADQGGLPANNFTETDRKFVVEIAGSISNTPQGLASKVDLAERVHKRNLDAETLWNNGNYDQTTEAGYRKYKKDWAAWVKAHPLFSQEEMDKIKTTATAPAGGGTVVPELTGPGWN